MSWYTVFTLATVVALLSSLTLVLNRTKIGLAFKAVSSNLESAELVGIRIGPTLQFGWALAAGIGTLGACIFIANPVLSIDPGFMVRVLIFSAAAAALGGLDSLWGAFVGGLVVGLSQSVLLPYIPFVPNQMSLAIAAVVLMVVLLVRPSGLFGTTTVRRL